MQLFSLLLVAIQAGKLQRGSRSSCALPTVPDYTHQPRWDGDWSSYQPRTSQSFSCLCYHPPNLLDCSPNWWITWDRRVIMHTNVHAAQRMVSRPISYQWRVMGGNCAEEEKIFHGTGKILQCHIKIRVDSKDNRLVGRWLFNIQFCSSRTWCTGGPRSERQRKKQSRMATCFAIATFVLHIVSSFSTQNSTNQWDSLKSLCTNILRMGSEITLGCTDYIQPQVPIFSGYFLTREKFLWKQTCRNTRATFLLQGKLPQDSPAFSNQQNCSISITFNLNDRGINLEHHFHPRTRTLTYCPFLAIGWWASSSSTNPLHSAPETVLGRTGLCRYWTCSKITIQVLSWATLDKCPPHLCFPLPNVSPEVAMPGRLWEALTLPHSILSKGWKECCG